MEICVETLHNKPHTRDVFIRDGWRLRAEEPNRLYISHPEVTEGHAVRERLDHLGLLTSREVRMEFAPCGDRIGKSN